MSKFKHLSDLRCERLCLPYCMVYFCQQTGDHECWRQQQNLMLIYTSCIALVTTSLTIYCVMTQVLTHFTAIFGLADDFLYH